MVRIGDCVAAGHDQGRRCSAAPSSSAAIALKASSTPSTISLRDHQPRQTRWTSTAARVRASWCAAFARRGVTLVVARGVADLRMAPPLSAAPPAIPLLPPAILLLLRRLRVVFESGGK